MKVSVTPKQLAGIRAIVDYDWATEQRDYEENDKPRGHVFEHLRRTDGWLRGLGS